MAQKRIITPTQVTQITQATNTLIPTQPQTYTPSLKATASLQQQLQAYYKAQRTKDKQTQTFLANYNDPTELNSYIDALTNREAVSKKFGETWGTVSTVSGTVAVLSFAAAIILAGAAFFTGGATAPAAGAAASAGASAAGGAAAGSTATSAALSAAAATAAKVGAVAAIPSIPAAADVTIEKGIKPILAGKPKEAGLNMLMNLGETMDFAANPVKGLVLEGPEGFIKATGLSDEGRVNYDYDTGFFLTDMLLEVVSDPTNWVDYGTGIAAKVATKNVGEVVTKQIVDNAVKTVNTTLAKSVGEISAEGAERITKKVSKTAAKLSKDLADSSFKNLTDEAKKLLVRNAQTQIQQSLINAIKTELPKAKWADIERILKRAGRSAETGRFTRSALKQITNIEYDTLATDIIKNIAAMQHYSDTFQKFMTKGAMMSSGYGLGIEAVRKGWKGVNAWMNNFTLNKLRKATVFDNVNGLDIKQYDQAKGIWDTCYQYTTALTGEVSQRDMNSFYAFMNQQLNRDKELISKILQESGTPLKKAARLDTQFKAIYNCDFNQYVAYLKGINIKESDIYKSFVDFAEAAKQTVNTQGFAKAAGASIKTGTQLFSAQNAGNIARLQFNLIEDLQKAVKQTKKGLVLTDKFYTIKLNNAYVNAMLLNNPVVYETLMKIRSSQSVGNLLNRIIADSNALEEHVSAAISTAVRTIKDAGASFGNINQLYNDIAGLAFNIKGIKSDDFKRYIIDQILGENKTVSGLLAGFDNSTMPALMNGLETMLYESNFKFNDYPTLKEQIAGAYKRFLQAQENANVEMVGATIVQDFTKSVDDLIEALPDYADELSELAAANDIIRTSLAAVKNKNFELLLDLFTDQKTIFNIANTRKLADLGLALKTVAIKENLDLFRDITTMPGHVLEASNKLGKRINRLKKQFEQYAVEFDADTTKAIRKAYLEVKEQMLTNKALSAEIADSATAAAFEFLKDTDNVFEQFAILNQYYKLDKAKDITDQFRDIVAKHLSTKEYLNLINPNNLLVTDFAWETIAQSAWIAEKQFNETLINSITAYHNLSLKSRKITNDFTALKNLVSTNKLDRPFMLQQERYIKVATKYNTLLQFFEQYYDSLFDKQIAEQQIENLRKVMLNFPKLNEKYGALVDDLDKYWRGELKFEQDAKWVLKAGVRPDKTKPVDTFTPFWNAIQEMNTDIRAEIQSYNNSLFKDYQFSHYKSNNDELYKQYREMRMDYSNVTPWDPIRKQQELNKLINRATDQNSKGALYNLFNLTPEQFNQELARRKRFITFKEDDLSDKQLKYMFDNFNKRLKNDDIFYFYDKEKHRHWYVLKQFDEKSNTGHKVNAQGRQVYLDGKAIITPKNKHTFDEFRLVDRTIKDKHPELTKHLNELEEDLELLTGSRLGDSQGEYFTQDTLQKLYDQMPTEVQEMFDIDEMLDKQFFESYAFNESVLGTMTSKRDLGMHSGNMITNLSNTLTQAQNYLKPKNEYVHAVFDSNFSLANPKGIYAGFSDNDLLAALQANTDYKLVALVDDKKYGMQVREIYPTSVAAIQKAKELGAVIVPLQTYKDMYNVVNHRIGSTGMAKLWSRIMYAYKFGFLCRPGAWIRNWFDTNLKSKLEMGDEYSTYQRMAHNILDEVDDMKTFIELRSEDGVYKSQAVREYFGLEAGYSSRAKHLTYEQYVELERDFLSQGISGNIIQNLNKELPEDAGWFETFKWLSGRVLDPANKTEEYNRLAMYLYELDKGLDYTTALSKLAKTHFDYSFKSKAEQLVELVFPFTTFSLRNYSYWIEMIEKHPWIARNYVHLMKPHWDFRDYTPEELAIDMRVQNQIMYGQLKLAEFNDKVITFKANPSIQDALQMFSDPINNVYEKLAAPFSIPLNTALDQYTQPTNAIPVIGPMIQSVKTMVDTGSPLPSAIGVSKAPRRTAKKDISKTFRNKNYKGMNTYRDKQYRVPTYRKNVVYDAYATKGVTRYRTNFYPIVDIAHDIKMSYSVNVANRIKNKVKTDVYKGIRYSLRLDANKFK